MQKIGRDNIMDYRQKRYKTKKGIRSDNVDLATRYAEGSLLIDNTIDTAFISVGGLNLPVVLGEDPLLPNTPPEVYILEFQNANGETIEYIEEGSTAYAKITYNGSGTGTVINYEIAGVQANDILVVLSGNVTTTNSVATIEIPVISDSITEGTESLVLTVGAYNKILQIRDPYWSSRTVVKTNIFTQGQHGAWPTDVAAYGQNITFTNRITNTNNTGTIGTKALIWNYTNGSYSLNSVMENIGDLVAMDSGIIVTSDNNPFSRNVEYIKQDVGLNWSAAIETISHPETEGSGPEGFGKPVVLRDNKLISREYWGTEVNNVVEYLGGVSVWSRADPSGQYSRQQQVYKLDYNDSSNKKILDVQFLNDVLLVLTYDGDYTRIEQWSGPLGSYSLQTQNTLTVNVGGNDKQKFSKIYSENEFAVRTYDSANDLYYFKIYNYNAGTFFYQYHSTIFNFDISTTDFGICSYADLTANRFFVGNPNANSGVVNRCGEIIAYEYQTGNYWLKVAEWSPSTPRTDGGFGRAFYYNGDNILGGDNEANLTSTRSTSTDIIDGIITIDLT